MSGVEQHLIKIEESIFGKLTDPSQELKTVKKFVLTNTKSGFSVSLISYGATIQAINVKDKNGKLTNVALGFESLQDQCSNPFFGSTIGRVANRISNAEFKLNDKVYKLEKNNGQSCLHGGSRGLCNKNWSSSLIENGVKFAYVSDSGEGGFPGEVWFETTYRIDPTRPAKLLIEMKAITDEPTPINLTNHAYLNLSGPNTKIYEHDLKIYASEYLDFNASDHTVTGVILKLNKGSRFDFNNGGGDEYVRIGDRIKVGGEWPDYGYDNFYVLDEKEGENRRVASVKNRSNGIRLDIFSNQNGVQLYTGNHLNIKKTSQGSIQSLYGIHDGFCLEVHNLPNSVNIEEFPSCILDPNDEYVSTIVYDFSIE